MENYYEIVSMVLFGIGFAALLLQRNLIKKIIGINIMDTSIFLYLTSKGFIYGGKAPILRDDVSLYINPIPSGLVLTGLVVGVSVTAFALALCIKIYKNYGTLDIDKLTILSKGGEV